MNKKESAWAMGETTKINKTAAKKTCGEAASDCLVGHPPWARM